MGILDTLLSALGLGSSSEERREKERETTVSVEREAQTETEAAVKGTDTDAVAAETEAAASTESLVEEEGPTDAAEPAEAAGPGAGAGETELDTAVSESQGEMTTEHEEAEPKSVEVIKGIGPAYARRLSSAGVDSVAELAAADADDLAEAVDLSPKRVGRWIERAREQ